MNAFSRGILAKCAGLTLAICIPAVAGSAEPENTPEKLAKGVYKTSLTEFILLSRKQNPEERLALLFTRFKEDVAHYKWLYFNPLTNDWVSGAGKVQEVYDKVKLSEEAKGVRVVAVPGHNTKIQAGEISIEWSRGNPNGGWIYFNPEHLTLKSLPADQFGKAEL